MKKITIQNEATIKANGTRESKLRKPVLCIETGEVFASAADTAESIGVHFSAISLVCLGKTKTCKGKHYCYLSSALENLDAIMARLREAAAMEVDAQKWRAQEAAKKAERLAKERHQQAIAKAEEKVAKLTEDCSKYETKWNETINALDEANRELEALRDEEAA